MTHGHAIALDLDGVLTEYPDRLARAARDHFGIDLPDHAFVDSIGLQVPDAVRAWVYSPQGPAGELVPAPGAQAFLAALLERFGPDRVRIITARPATFAAETREWLRSWGFPPCRVNFTVDKVAAAREFEATHAVEDSLRHALAYAAAGIHCLLLGDQPSPEALPPTIQPVTNLGDARRRLIDDEGGSAVVPVPRHSPGVSRQRAADSPQRPRIVISDVIDADARTTLAREADIIDVDGTNPVALRAALRDADALIVRSETRVGREVLAAGPRLRVVARAGVGVDNIDVPSATEAGILVLNAPGANATSAGEHTIALLLAIARSIPEANASTHAGRWERRRFRPFELRGKTVGIVGLGRVGAVVAQRLGAFEMRRIGYDPYIAPTRFQQLGVERVSYETLLQTADIVTFHVPATSETIGMLDPRTLDWLKPGAIVLNCARGDIVDATALAAAVRAGRVAGAGIDVFAEEPAREHPLFGLPNVVLTPHLGGSSAEALATVGAIISTTTLAALRGEVVPNAVNLPPTSLAAGDLQRLTQVAEAAGHLLAVLQPGRPGHVHLSVQGVVPGDVTDHVLGAVLCGALRRWTDRHVTPVNAALVARAVKLEVTRATEDAVPARLPEFTVAVSGETPHRVTVRWDGAEAGILEVDRFSLERPLAGHLLITHHQDRPGIVGQIGTILGARGVNIAGMQVGRHHRGGEAIMVLNVDDPLPAVVLAEIAAVPFVTTAYVVSLPPIRAVRAHPARGVTAAPPRLEDAGGQGGLTAEVADDPEDEQAS